MPFTNSLKRVVKATAKNLSVFVAERRDYELAVGWSHRYLYKFYGFSVHRIFAFVFFRSGDLHRSGRLENDRRAKTR